MYVIKIISEKSGKASNVQMFQWNQFIKNLLIFTIKSDKLRMDFDSPDVEKDFPGLYASESGSSRKKNEEDCKYL